jgi:AcrR family transcriptional regulator
MDGPTTDGPSRGRPRAEPRQEQHRRILRAARQAFGDEGYEGVTLSRIAADAGVSRPTVYEVVYRRGDP